MHNLIMDNCHSYIADFLNSVEYQGKTNWNQISIFKMITFRSKYLSWGHMFRVYVWTFILYFILFIMGLFLATTVTAGS